MSAVQKEKVLSATFIINTLKNKMKDLNLINDLEYLKSEETKILRNIRIDKMIEKLSNGRDIKQHRQFWKLASKVAENTQDENWNTSEKVVNQCKIELKFIDSWFFYQNPKKPDEQKLQLQFKSISFSECNQADFDVFFDGAVKIMANKLNITVSELLRGEL